MTRELADLRVAGLAAAGLSLAVIASPAIAQDDLRTVRIGWPAAIASNLAHVSFGEELGLFAEEGLVTEVTVMQGAFNVVQQVLAGGFDTGYVGVEAVVVGQQPDTPELPARMVYNYTRESIWELVVLADSDIQEVFDLGGRTIGVGGLAFGNVPVTRALISSLGLDSASVQLLPVGVGGPAFRALTTGEIDVLNLWDTMNAALERTGAELRRLEYPEAFQGYPSHGLIATNRMIEDEGEFLTAFGRAWARSEVACAANIDGCLTAFWDRFPELMPDMPLEEALAYERPLLEARLDKLLSFPDGEVQHGAFTDEMWDGIISALEAGDMISFTEIDPAALYTNEFVEGYNDFDPAEVEALAQAYK